jgi:hypothetical protein
MLVIFDTIFDVQSSFFSAEHLNNAFTFFIFHHNKLIGAAPWRQLTVIKYLGIVIDFIRKEWMVLSG